MRGQIVGHGGSPRQAQLAARANRYKEKPEISFVPPSVPLSFAPVLDRILPYVGDVEIYLAGGAVRDALMGRESHDFDFAVATSAIEVAKRVARGMKADFYVLDESFDTARVIVTTEPGPNDVLDFAAFRGADIDADLAGRDFTINAIAYDPRTRSILDPLGGGTDLRAKLIRMCSAGAMREDPVRILRAVRQAAAFGFKISAETRESMKSTSKELPTVSPERQRDELFRILDGPEPEVALKALDVLGSMAYLLPELMYMKGVGQSPPHVSGVWEHTLSVVRHLAGILVVLGPDSEAARNREMFSGMLAMKLGRYRQQLQTHFSGNLPSGRTMRGLLFFAALYHDAGKPATRSVREDGHVQFLGHETVGAAAVLERANTYNLSNDESSRVTCIVANHMRFNHLVARMQAEGEIPPRRAVYRFFRAAGDTGIEQVVLGLADQWGMREHELDQRAWSATLDVARTLLENYFEKPEESVRPPRLLDGNVVMQAYGIPPGPMVGALLEAIREAQAAGEVMDLDVALAFGRNWLEDHQA